MSFLINLKRVSGLPFKRALVGRKIEKLFKGLFWVIFNEDGTSVDLGLFSCNEMLFNGDF